MKICKVDGCNKKHLAKGLCQFHYHAEHRKANRAACCAKSSKWRLANRGQALAATDAWKAAKPQWEIDYRKANRKALSAKSVRWAKAHPDSVNARHARRRAKKLKAAPKWANNFYITEIYDFARRRTKALGIQHHVDHIVPLVSELVCGLHVEHNLRVIPAIDNLTKKNCWCPDMPSDGIA